MDINLGDNRSLIIRLAEKAHSRELPDFLAPPETLGKPRAKTPEYKECMAMDRCIRNVLSGFKDDLMYSATPMFVGYAMLSNISQEALIRAGVETVATEMTRKFIQWTYDDDYGEEDKEKAIADLEEESRKFKLKEIFNQAAVKDGYFGGCLVYIDVGELDDDEKEEPLILDEKTFKKGSFKGFKVIEPINIYPGEYNTIDPTDEHYFNPEYWYILGKKYHASRFLYFAGNEAPLLLKPAYNFFGIPQAQLALDYVAHFVANREAAQELLNKFSLTCWKTDMTQALQGRGVNDLVQRAKVFNRLKSNNGMMILDKEREDMVQINTPLSGVRDIVEMSLNLLTAVWHIPKIEYLGEGEGGLNASSKEQIRSYYDYIIGKKEKLFTEPLETVSKVLQLNKWGKINPAISFKFPAMWDMDDSEKAALNKQQADRDAIYLANGVLSQEEVRRRLSLDKNSEYTMIDVDDLPEQAEEPLNEINEQEENEEVRKAMDMAMDDRWITIGHKDGDEDGEEHKGRHILLKNGESPIDALERTTGTDIDKDGKVGKKGNNGGENRPETKPEEKSKPEEKKPEENTESAEKNPSGKGEKIKEKSVEEMTDEELEKTEEELDKKYNEYNRKKLEAIKSDKELQDLEKDLEETRSAYYKADMYTDESRNLSNKIDEIQKKIYEKNGELSRKYEKENEKEYNDITKKLSKVQNERYKREQEKEKISYEKSKELSKKLEELLSNSEKLSEKDFSKKIEELRNISEKELMSHHRNALSEKLYAADFEYKSNTVGKTLKEYSKKNDSLIKELETFDDPYQKYSEEKEQEQKEIEELRSKRDSEQDPDKKKAYHDEIIKRVLGSHIMDDRKDVNKIKYERSMAIANLLRKQNNTNSKVEAGQSTIKGIYDKLNGLLGGVIGSNIKTSDAPKVQALRGRAYYSSSQNLFKIERDADFGDVVHEYTHFLERNNPKMLANSLAFAEYRTKGENAMRMSALTGNRGYRSDEIAKKDRFFSPYCGKIYSQTNEYRTAHASEIMSMGVERLFREPAKFAKEDREYFDFVVANLRGEL